ncbi:MAG TPA: EF-P lysine aminoacylase EpmA [Candidatus Eisenbacteria bacterium]|nr:EF-P lysine aminoacylase EpmA [Candidatus Eisenbacteria bacterium]
MTAIKNWKRWKTDPEYRARMEKRAAIIAGVRSFFASRGFMEAETPTIVAYPGMEPHLDPFATTLRRNDGAGFAAHLITSPEYSLKKLLAAGLPKIFDITRCYRDGEPWDGGHNPEFTMIEWYRADADYTAIMRDTEELAAELAAKTTGSAKIRYQGRTLDLSAPWPRMTVAEAMDRYAGIDLAAGIDDPERFRAAVEAKGCPTDPKDAFDDVFFRIFLRDVEPKLGDDGRPVILYEYPRSMAALARLKPGDGRYAERFEAYCGGMELCNAFSELNDAAEQRRRLEEEQAQRASLGRPVYGLDEDFLEAVGKMPPSAGIALGVDRLVMLLTDAPTIRDVLFFPAGDLFTK